MKRWNCRQVLECATPVALCGVIRYFAPASWSAALLRRFLMITDCIRSKVHSAGSCARRRLSQRLVAILGLSAIAGSAQTPTNTGPAQDPLMSLLLSQPRIEIASSFSVSAEFDPPVIRPGEQGYYRVTINALQDSVLCPEKIPGPPQLDIRAGARGQIFQAAAQFLEPRSSFLFHVRASTPGDFTVPSFPLTVYGKTAKVPAASLHVSE